MPIVLRHSLVAPELQVSIESPALNAWKTGAEIRAGIRV
jgi:hypothetical protein